MRMCSVADLQAVADPSQALAAGGHPGAARLEPAALLAATGSGCACVAGGHGGGHGGGDAEGRGVGHRNEVDESPQGDCQHRACHCCRQTDHGNVGNKEAGPEA